MRINLEPTECNLCGGKVIYTDNSLIYGKSYGSGKCYLCLSCGAYVGTHVSRPKEAFGILADHIMREGKRECHNLFDSMWNNRKGRRSLYERLAKEMNIPKEECHFGYFDLNQLFTAYNILKTWRNNTMSFMQEIKDDYERSKAQDPVNTTVKLMLKKFGENSQIDVAIEEMSELIKELIKYKRSKVHFREKEATSREHVIEEIGDVMFMIEYLKEIFKIKDEDVLSIVKQKAIRTKERYIDGNQ